MKLHILTLAVLATLASTHVLPPTDTSLTNLTYSANLKDTPIDHVAATFDPSTVHTAADPPPPNAKFDKAVSTGQTLDSAMKSKDSVARWLFKDFPQYAETCQSPFTGDGRADLAKWGFDDSDALSEKIKNECDFDAYHKIKATFDEIGLDTKAAKDGGPNRCFKVNHRDGPAIKRDEKGELPNEAKQYYDVCGREYRATGASYEFAANPHGLLALMNIMSMTYSAKTYTWFRTPLPSELPDIGTTQDIAWAMWNRVAATSPAGLKGLKYLLVTQVMNAGSREIFRHALGLLDPPESEYKVWPGHEFVMDGKGKGGKGGLAILGSPVGRWAGYLLLQHKDQLGGNRYIEKVRLFKPPGASLPYLLFYVAKDPWVGEVKPVAAKMVSGMNVTNALEMDDDAKNVVRREDEKNLIRQHVVVVRT
ncbi:uncharacterized protein J4E79_011824 [Alternaria viburni]|uniref:uncharacterized protein n=1 Tax=Alternaria viburni TaxID=566460 RepID=UPI0020C49689|nr:uncharacterized protein J4E79_011824 [Alternaria viburni]KAI4640243.1 hypothetical protein J4E79_011824 [Alternaria viburni]